MSRSLIRLIFLLTLGYSGYYLCRSSFSVAKPLLLDAFPHLDKAALGLIASVGTLLYAAGKLVLGPLSDRLGGKTMFLFGMAGAIGFSLLFAFGGPPLFMLAWSGNRFVQSGGWGGMVRMVANWTPRAKYGAVMGLVSLSYLFGDFLSRLLLAKWVDQGATWSDLFTRSALGLVLIAIPVVIFLRERPPAGEAPQAPQETLVEKTKGLDFLRNRRFLAICLISFCFTLLRETFNEWTPVFLHEQAGMSEAAAAAASSLFPLFGGLSVLAMGFLSDGFASTQSPTKRLKLLPLGLLIGGFLMAGLAWIPLPAVAMTGLVGAIAFVLIGPYSLLAGATSLDFGRAASPSTASGWIDGIGYFGGILSGYVVGDIAQTQGWGAAMGTLAVTSIIASVLMHRFLKNDWK